MKRPHPIRCLTLLALSSTDTSQQEWTSLIEAASADPVPYLGLRDAAQLCGNVLAFHDDSDEWVAAFAQTAANFGVSTLLWLTPERKTDLEPRWLAGQGVIPGIKMSLEGVPGAEIRPRLEAHRTALRQDFGIAPAFAFLDITDNLIEREAARLGITRIVEVGSGINWTDRSPLSTRVSSNPELEMAWLRGDVKAAARVASQAPGLNRVLARLRSE